MTVVSERLTRLPTGASPASGGVAVPPAVSGSGIMRRTCPFWSGTEPMVWHVGGVGYRLRRDDAPHVNTADRHARSAVDPRARARVRRDRGGRAPAVRRPGRPGPRGHPVRSARLVLAGPGALAPR